MSWLYTDEESWKWLMYKNKTVLSLFSSAGIGELGIKKLGLQILVSNELLHQRCLLYKENYQDVKNICGDIWKNKKRL